MSLLDCNETRSACRYLWPISDVLHQPTARVLLPFPQEQH